MTSETTATVHLGVGGGAIHCKNKRKLNWVPSEVTGEEMNLKEHSDDRINEVVE
jgi:hypothetical protein